MNTRSSERRPRSTPCLGRSCNSITLRSFLPVTTYTRTLLRHFIYRYLNLDTVKQSAANNKFPPRTANQIITCATWSTNEICFSICLDMYQQSEVPTPLAASLSHLPHNHCVNARTTHSHALLHLHASRHDRGGDGADYDDVHDDDSHDDGARNDARSPPSDPEVDSTPHHHCHHCSRCRCYSHSHSHIPNRSRKAHAFLPS
jgi:hypothetical protein